MRESILRSFCEGWGSTRFAAPGSSPAKRDGWCFQGRPLGRPSPKANEARSEASLRAEGQVPGKQKKRFLYRLARSAAERKQQPFAA
jgi:hypothetical protein